jgi:hypothetical protein
MVDTSRFTARLAKLEYMLLVLAAWEARGLVVAVPVDTFAGDRFWRRRLQQVQQVSGKLGLGGVIPNICQTAKQQPQQRQRMIPSISWQHVFATLAPRLARGGVSARLNAT